MFNPKPDPIKKQQSFVSQMITVQDEEPSGSMMTMLSPRNLMKFISTTIEEYNTKPKVYKADYAQQHELMISFDPYWSKIQNQYKKYTKNKGQKVVETQKQQRNEQLQMKLKLEKIPQSYFDQKYEMFFTEKFNKVALRRKQEEATEYLDQIELLLWNKTSKNPQKYFNCVDNFDGTIDIVAKNLQKVKKFRQDNNKKLIKINQSQLKIKKIHERKQRIELTLAYLQSIKKLKSIKQQSQNSESAESNDNQLQSKLQILQNIKKKQLQECSHIKSLQKIVNNLQFYRQELKSNIYQQFNQEIVELMGKLLAYDKNQWKNSKVQLLGKEKQLGTNLQESRLNITILDQSCFGTLEHGSYKDVLGSDKIIHQNMLSKHAESIKKLVQRLSIVWEAITKFDLYDEVQINQLIMRQLVRHNVLWSHDLDQYLMRQIQKIEESQRKLQVNPILEQQGQNQDQSQRSKQISTEQHSQQPQQLKSSTSPKKNKYFSSISQFTKINQLTNLKDLSQLKKKTINTFKRFGNMKKLGEALTSGSSTSSSQNPTNIPQTQSYCKLKQNQVPQQQIKTKKQPQENLSKVDTKFFLKAVKFYYQILSSLIRFIKKNEQLVFFQHFMDKFQSFVEQRVRFFFSLRHISQKTTVADFLLYLNLIEFWYDVCDDVYESLIKLKGSITDQYLTLLQKHALVEQLKKSIDESSYLACSIPSSNINSIYYVFFWNSIQQLKQHEANNMSLTILRQDSPILSFQDQNAQNKNVEIINFQSQFKIIDKKIIYKKQEFFVCQSFLILIKELQKYLQLRQVLHQFNSNIEQKICELIGFYVWYNLKNLNKTGPNIKPRTLKNLCNIYSTISFLKITFNEQLSIKNKKMTKTLEQFQQFLKSLDNNITMTPFLLIQQQISLLYQNNTMNVQFQVPCKETSKILEIFKLSLEELKIHFYKDKIIKILEPTIKVIVKNYFGYLVSLGKRGLLEVKEFLPKFKELLLNYGFKFSSQSQSKQKNSQTHIFLKEITEMEKNFRSKVSQIK